MTSFDIPRYVVTSCMALSFSWNTHSLLKGFKNSLYVGTRKLDPLKEVGMKGDERRRKKKGVQDGT